MTWFSKNEKTIRWATMLGSWAAGVVVIATGVGVGPGLAIIGAGTAFGTGHVK